MCTTVFNDSYSESNGLYSAKKPGMYRPLAGRLVAWYTSGLNSIVLCIPICLVVQFYIMNFIFEEENFQCYLSMTDFTN